MVLMLREFVRARDPLIRGLLGACALCVMRVGWRWGAACWLCVMRVGWHAGWWVALCPRGASAFPPTVNKTKMYL